MEDTYVNEKGVKDFDNFMAALEDQGQGSLGVDVMEKATRAMAVIVLKRMKRTVAFADRSGNLRKSFRIRKTTLAERRRARGRALPLYRIKAAPHWFLVNFGHTGGVGKDGVYRGGDAAPHPYVEPALFGTRGEQRKAFERRAKSAYRNIVKRLKSGNLTKRQQRLAENRII